MSTEEKPSLTMKRERKSNRMLEEPNTVAEVSFLVFMILTAFAIFYMLTSGIGHLQVIAILMLLTSIVFAVVKSIQAIIRRE